MRKSLSSSINIPDQMQNDWQDLLNLLATLAQVPAALIMRVSATDIEVFSSNDSDNNPYRKGDREPLNQKLYCENVINNRQQLTIPNALKEPHWDSNPDLAYNMIAYCGLPLFWPDNTPFGTICILDNKENTFCPTYQALLKTYQQSIEAQLSTLLQHAELLTSHQELQNKVNQATHYINEINIKLTTEIDCRRAAEQKVIYHQNHDIGTGFLNQAAAYHHIEDLIDKKRHFSLLYIHFSNGKHIQQEYGHQALDLLLTEYRARLTKIKGSYVTGRVDSSDILLIIESNTQTLPTLCTHLSEVSQSTYNVKSQPLHLQSYIGAITSEAQTSRNSLLQGVYKSAFECQYTGKPFSISKPTPCHTSCLSESKVEQYLLESVRNKNLSLSYQPKVCPRSKTWLGCEALLRWTHPKLDDITNDVLIPLAEQNGLIYELGNFVLRNAIQQTSKWTKHDPAFVTAVNISPIQLKDPAFVEHVKQLLELYQVTPKNLELEVTESVLISDETQAIHTLTQLHDLGVLISLDDFGTGYSSFQYLKKYPFDILKIDKSFIEEIDSNHADQNIVSAMINIAKQLKLQVVIEGIENQRQERFAIREKVDAVQGYLYSKPMPAHDFENGLFNQSSIGTPYFQFM